MNQLLCFATFVGGWKAIQPRQAIALKHQPDEIKYANRVLFSEQLLTAYHTFMTTLFAMYGAAGADALLRAPIKSQWGDRRNLPWWDDSVASLFATTAASLDDIQAAHVQLADGSARTCTSPARPSPFWLVSPDQTPPQPVNRRLLPGRPCRSDGPVDRAGQFIWRQPAA